MDLYGARPPKTCPICMIQLVKSLEKSNAEPGQEPYVDLWNTWLSHAQRTHPDYLEWNEDWSKKSWKYAIPFILAIPIIFLSRNIMLIFILAIGLVIAILPVVLIPRRAFAKFRKAWERGGSNT